MSQMNAEYKESNFEDAIEASLLAGGSYLKGSDADYNRELALFPDYLFAFLEATQQAVLAKLQSQVKGELRKAILDTLCKDLASRGTLDVLRHGIKVYGKPLKLAYFAPASGLNPELGKLYEQNLLHVSRQVHYSLKNENSVDLLISLNGLPVATAELKNHFTGQNVTHAKRQYMKDRDPGELLFTFDPRPARSMVHFAVDPDEVFMTTRLKGNDTHFLPFNKGNGNGAGNPEVESNYKTHYLWEEVWRRDSWLDILGQFMHLQETEQKSGKEKFVKRVLIFPRYHQLDAVRKLIATATGEGAGQNYLVQHSAGSGKSNTIGWLAHRLASLHNAANERVFDTVIVVTDRRVLDKQLQQTIYQFEHKQGVVEPIDKDSTQLSNALAGGVPIIITTLQKFPFVMDKVADLPKRRYALIVDEAHSSQSGESAKKMKAVLSANDLEEAEAQDEGLFAEEDYIEDEVLKSAQSRGQQANLSFFAFTATPKYKTLKIFGRPGADGKEIPFHLYGMRQAIEEGFILDVLKNYTTYKRYFKLIKAIEDDPQVVKKKAASALARFVSLHPHEISQKTEIIIEHFRRHTKKLIGGRAKAMVVTRSRMHAVRYRREFDKYIADKGYADIKALVAFSGTVIDESKSYTEVEMNKGIKESELPRRFGSNDFQVLIVADKYQTGFDEPLLHSMYVDKRLSGIQAVQTLSRLNRTHEGKESTFVLDFVNEMEEIQQSFQPYYEATTITEDADPHQLYDLQHKLDAFQVYHKSEIEEFAKVFFKPKTEQSNTEHQALNGIIDKAVGRFQQLDEEKQDEFRSLATSYRNLYSFLAQIIPYEDSDLEKLYAYIRLLVSKLPRQTGGPRYDFEDEVALKYWRMQKISSGQIELTPGEPGELPAPTDVGTGGETEDKVELSSLLEKLNDRFGTDFKPADALFFEQIKESAKADSAIAKAAQVNEIENFEFIFNKAFDGLVIDREEQNKDIVGRLLNDKEFKKLARKFLMERVYNDLRGEAAAQ